MQKKFLAIILVLTLCFALAIPSFAAEDEDTTEGLVDAVPINEPEAAEETETPELTDEEKAALEAAAAAKLEAAEKSKGEA